MKAKVLIQSLPDSKRIVSFIINSSYIKKILFVFLLFCSVSAYSQNYFKNTKPIIIYKSGENDHESAKLKNGGTLSVKFKGFQVNVSVIYSKTAFNVDYFEETDECEFIEFAEYDFNKDGNSELVIAYGNDVQFKVSVYQLLKNKIKHIGEFDDGQFDCILDKKSIQFPYGTQGLFTEYTYTNGMFVKTN